MIREVSEASQLLFWEMVGGLKLDFGHGFSRSEMHVGFCNELKTIQESRVLFPFSEWEKKLMSYLKTIFPALFPRSCRQKRGRN